MTTKQARIQWELDRVYGGAGRLLLTVEPPTFNHQTQLYFTGELVAHIGSTVDSSRHPYAEPRFYVRGLDLRAKLDDWMLKAAEVVHDNETAVERQNLGAEHDRFVDDAGTAHNGRVLNCPRCEALESSARDDAFRARWQTVRFEEKVGDLRRTLDGLMRDIEQEMQDFRNDPRGVGAYREGHASTRAAQNVTNLVTQAVSNMRLGDVFHAAVLADSGEEGIAR